MVLEWLKPLWTKWSFKKRDHLNSGPVLEWQKAIWTNLCSPVPQGQYSNGPEFKCPVPAKIDHPNT
jgi:hypothetical protein